ncbi:hypothetical protein GCM10025795_37890 [Verticiella sediminum]
MWADVAVGVLLVMVCFLWIGNQEGRCGPRARAASLLAWTTGSGAAPAQERRPPIASKSNDPPARTAD